MNASKAIKTLSSLLTLKLYIACILFMNVADAGLTWYWVHNGIAEELNPIMDYALVTSPILFFATKITLTSLGCYLLWRLRSVRFSKICAAALVGVYLGIMIAHASIGWNIFF